MLGQHLNIIVSTCRIFWVIADVESMWGEHWINLMRLLGSHKERNQVQSNSGANIVSMSGRHCERLPSFVVLWLCRPGGKIDATLKIHVYRSPDRGNRLSDR